MSGPSSFVPPSRVISGSARVAESARTCCSRKIARAKFVSSATSMSRNPYEMISDVLPRGENCLENILGGSEMNERQNENQKFRARISLRNRSFVYLARASVIRIGESRIFRVRNVPFIEPHAFVCGD